MKIGLLMSLVIGTAFACPAQQILAEYDWQKLAQAVPGATLVSMDGRSALKIFNTNATPLRVQLLKIVQPPITNNVYALTGDVKYEGVKGDGFLEMWNYFPPEKAGLDERGYFSRTMGLSGEMGKISGTSEWRTFKLPFDHTGVAAGPARLEFNLVLPGPGIVYLAPVKLVQYRGSLSGALTPANAWWSDRTGGLVGGIGGSLIGILGALLGWLSTKGKAPGFVLRTMTLLAGLGVGLTIASVLAILSHQPYGVWFPLLLGGVLLTGIFSSRFCQFRRRYEELELRKMTSLDA